MKSNTTQRIQFIEFGIGVVIGIAIYLLVILIF